MKKINRIEEPLIAININQTYRDGLSVSDLYEFTRGIWRLSKERAEDARFAFAVYKGVIKEVYEIKNWLPAGSTEYSNRQFKPEDKKNRYEFVGNIASENIRNKYLESMMPELHSQNPIRYYNC